MAEYLSIDWLVSYRRESMNTRNSGHGTGRTPERKRLTVRETKPETLDRRRWQVVDAILAANRWQ